MNKFTYSMLALALSVNIYSASAATTNSNTDDGSAIGTSETPKIKQQDVTNDRAPAKKNMSKKHQTHKNTNMNSQSPDGANSDLREDKAIGTTSGIPDNVIKDDTKMGDPIEGTNSSISNDSSTSGTKKDY